MLAVQVKPFEVKVFVPFTPKTNDPGCALTPSKPRVRLAWAPAAKATAAAARKPSKVYLFINPSLMLCRKLGPIATRVQAVCELYVPRSAEKMRKSEQP